VRITGLALGALLLSPGCKNEPEEAERAPIVGTVLSPHGDGVDVVPGASVRLEGGEEVEADERGQFVIPAAPIGEPVRLLVEGPRAFDPDVPQRFGTQVLDVVVPDDQGLSVFPHLLRACAGIVPSGGGEVADPSCAGGGGISVTFGADAFEAAVEVEMAALHPDRPSDVLGLPDDGLGAGGPAILGGIEVHLRDAATGDPVTMADGATATVRFELASLPEDIPEGDVVFEFFDERRGVYHDPHPVRIVTEGERRFGEVTVAHFSRGRAGPLVPAVLSECVTFETEVCRPSGRCDGSVPSVHVLDLRLRRAFQPTLARGDGEVCIPLRAGTPYDILFRWADPFTATLVGEPVYQTKLRHVTPMLTAPPREATCPDDCEPLNGGRTISLAPLPYGCARAQLFSSGGGDPVVGPIHVFVDGDHVSSAVIPGPGVCTPECDNEFCVQVPILDAGREVEIRGADGANLQFLPDPATAGQSCPRKRPFPCGYCDGAGSCQDLGAIVSDCDETGQLGNPCLSADFHAVVTPDAGGCTGATNLQLVLDGSPSTGAIDRYEWTVDRLDGADPVDGRQMQRIALADPICVAPGEYRIRLDVYEAGLSWILAREERVVTLGTSFPGPCSEVRLTDLTESVPQVVETCTYTWDGSTPTSRDCVVAPSDTRLLQDLVPDCGFPCLLTVFPPALEGIGAARTRQASPADAAFDFDTVSVLDGFGNAITTTQSTPTITSVRHYVYDDPARPTRVEERGDDGGAPGPIIGVWHLTWTGGDVVEAGFDHFGDGTVDTTYTRTFAQGRLQRIELVSGPLSTALHYAYDGGGNLITITQDDATGTPSVQRQFDYSCW